MPYENTEVYENTEAYEERPGDPTSGHRKRPDQPSTEQEANRERLDPAKVNPNTRNPGLPRRRRPLRAAVLRPRLVA